MVIDRMHDEIGSFLNWDGDGGESRYIFLESSTSSAGYAFSRLPGQASRSPASLSAC